jgi:hypothetical protein
MPERLCVLCTQFTVDMGWPGTDVTAGDSATIECLKGHWSMSNWERTDTFRQNIERAVTCPDFVEVPHDTP